MTSFLERLKQRKVGRWALAYLAGAWVVLQVMEVVSSPLRLSPSVQLGVLVILVLGFPCALVLAWYHGEKGRQRVTIRELLVLAGLVALGGVAVAAFAPWGGADGPIRGAPPEDLTIAVLPPRYIGPDSSDAYFAEAVAEELRDRLSDIVPVKSREAVARFAEGDRDMSTIAAELGVSHLVEVSVRRDGNRARVAVQLTETSTGFGAWSDVFEDESEDWFALHQEMALEFADALGLYLTPEQAESMGAHRTLSREAYDEYWRGWELLESFHANLRHPPDEYRQAEAHFRRALEEDPDYPLALAGLSMAYGYAYFYGVDRSEGRLELAVELANQALSLDPRLAEGHAALAQARGNLGDETGAIQAYREALRYDEENAVVWCLLAAVCTARGEDQDLEQAVEAAREAIRIDPEWFYSYLILGTAFERLGRYEEAAEAFAGGIEVDPEGTRSIHYGLGRVQLQLGNHAEALESLRTAQERGESGTLLLYVGAAQAGLGNTDEALEAIERGLSRGADVTTLDAVATSPYFADLRGDPRFVALLDRFRDSR